MRYTLTTSNNTAGSYS